MEVVKGGYFVYLFEIKFIAFAISTRLNTEIWFSAGKKNKTRMMSQYLLLFSILIKPNTIDSWTQQSFSKIKKPKNVKFGTNNLNKLLNKH